LGQPDENQLYYMQSRGMNRTQAIQLLTIGYLLPIATIIDDETVREEIREEIEKKVQLCKM
jgi:Fe-S cluster assembly protein SufD